MIDGYFDYYITNVALHLLESKNREFARRMGINAPEGDPIAIMAV